GRRERVGGGRGVGARHWDRFDPPGSLRQAAIVREITMSARWLFVAIVVALAAPGGAAAQTPQGEVTIAWHVTIATSWFDPSTAPAQITPFGMLYALHDALVPPLPGGQKMR